METIPSCPFCDFKDSDAYFLVQHVELCHPENGTSPFITAEDTFDNNQRAGFEYENSQTPSHSNTPVPDGGEFNDPSSYVECPTGCGEAITLAELSSHLDLHVAEGLALDEFYPQPAKSQNQYDIPGGYQDADLYGDGELDSQLDKEYGGRDDVLSSKYSSKEGKRARDRPVNLKSSKQKTKSIKARSSGGSSKQLGKSELGPHAHEKQMPGWLRKLLEDGSKVTWENKIRRDGKLEKVEVAVNETRRLIPVLAQLCEQDDSVTQAFLCNPDVRHVFKLPKEGGFCGYRNIQMLVSYIQGAGAQGHQNFPGRLPSILQLQDMIESAWDIGYNSTGRIETGGIKGTRKYIGTSEAQALFLSLGIDCQPGVFSKSADRSAHDALCQSVGDYFLKGEPISKTKRVVQTQLPPIYLQHPGHSLTIVGFEFRANGSVTLLVFDPMFKTSPAAERLIDTKVSSQSPHRILRAFRRGSRYLGQYNEFETLRLAPSQPAPRSEARSVDG